MFIIVNIVLRGKIQIDIKTRDKAFQFEIYQ